MKNYVKEYKGFPVPEGATHASNFDYEETVEFYKKIDGQHYFYAVPTRNCWCLSPSNQLNRNAIELPEAPQKWNGEGVPPVGTVCECFVWTNFAGGEKRWVPRPVIGHSKTSWSETHKGKSGIVVDSCEHDGKFIFCDKFRPLKTQQEKDREAFVTEAIKYGGAGMCFIEFSHNLFIAGARFTAPKAGE